MNNTLIDVNVCPIRHRTALDIVATYFCEPRPVKHRKDFEARVVDWPLNLQDVRNHKFHTVREGLDHLNTIGYWAFCKRSPKRRGVNELHYWLTPGVAVEDMVCMFAHELWHIAGHPSEKAACTVGAVAGFATMLMQQLRYKPRGSR